MISPQPRLLRAYTPTLTHLDPVEPQTRRRAGSQQAGRSKKRIPLEEIVQDQLKKPETHPKTDKILVLDLDNTLIWNSMKEERTPVKGVLTRIKVRNEMFLCNVVKRPGLEKFIKSMSRYYRLFIYTTGMLEYALGILKAVDLGHYFEKIYHRDDCFHTSSGFWLKDLNKINEDPKKLVFIDDSLTQVYHNSLNSVRILPFEGDQEDNALEKLTPFLTALAEIKDVRPVYDRFARYVEKKTLKVEKPRAEARCKSLEPRRTNLAAPIQLVSHHSLTGEQTDCLHQDSSPANLPQIQNFSAKLLELIKTEKQSVRQAGAGSMVKAGFCKTERAGKQPVEKKELNKWKEAEKISKKKKEEIQQEESENVVFLEDEEEETHSCYTSVRLSEISTVLSMFPKRHSDNYAQKG